MRKTQILAIPIIIALALTLTPLTPAKITIASAAGERIYFKAASFDQSGYPVGASPSINAKIAWEDLTANRTVVIELWNSTNVMATLETYTVPYNVSGTLTPDGSVLKTWTPSADLCDEVGTYTYYLKMFSGGVLVSEKTLTLVVAEESIAMSVTWQDANNDRVVALNELVTFTCYINWAFVETTEAHALYVDYGNGEQLLSSVTVTAGSGSQTVTDSHGFNSVGSRTIKFILKDSTGTTVKEINVPLTVGSTTSTTQESTTTSSGSLVSLIQQNWEIVAIAAALMVVGYIYMEKNQEEPEPTRRRR